MPGERTCGFTTKRVVLLLLLATTALCSSSLGSENGEGKALARGSPDPVWVLDPAQPGENLPAAGRSLFDRLFVSVRHGKADYDLPFPFAALLARLDAQLSGDSGSLLPPAKRVLIPLGRSLQRTAAAPDYFAFPRVVVAADSSPSQRSTLLLKDRLYIGYQEKSDVLEVISYNESAARFEFQLVKNYRAGAKPQVVYANRTLCYGCHQNGAPIFSRALWDETNANATVAALLRASGKNFYGISPDRGVDVPYAIDIAVKRANRFALTQRLWREGCGGEDRPALRCRAGLFTAALQHALSGGRQGMRSGDFMATVDAPLRSHATRRWPAGLAVGTADIPNRNPLQGLNGPNSWPDDAQLRASYAHVAARFEPLALRPSQEIWHADAGDAVSRLVDDLSEFVADNDRQRLATTLSAGPAERLPYRASCRFETRASRWSARCQSASGESGPNLAATLELKQGRASGGRIDRLSLPEGGTINGVALAVGTRLNGEHSAFVPSSRSTPRGADGNPLARIAFQLSSNDPEAGWVSIEFRQEFRRVEQAVTALLEGPDGLALFGARPIPREALFAALLAKLRAADGVRCCQKEKPHSPPELTGTGQQPTLSPAVPLSPPHADSAVNPASASINSAVQKFYPYCATCHYTPETFPPSFLSGTEAEVNAQLRQCAPRLFVRLSMAELTPALRDKTPMPPESLLPIFGTDAEGWRTSPVRAALLAQVGDWLRAESGRAPSLSQLLAGGYEALRPCLANRNTASPSLPR